MADRDLTAGVPASELSGGMLAGRVGDEQVLLVRDGEAIHAVGATCSHYGAPLADGAVINGTIRCPWHHACFNLLDGSVLRAPALAPLPVWRVERRDGLIVVRERVETVEPDPAAGPGSVVIIGAGPAGVNVADTLRGEGYAGRIVILTSENDLPYDKPNLSKGFLAGTAPAEFLPLHPSEHYENQRIELRLGVTVISIDTAANEIETSSGERLPFGALVLATGCAARRLPLRGAGRVRYLRTRADAEQIVADAVHERSAVVIGSSFIGLEVAASLRQKGLSVVVVSPDRIPLEHILGPDVGSRIRDIHEEHGVVFRLDHSVEAIEPDAVLLDDGSRLEAGIVIAGIGVTPSLELARAAGISVANGVVVNEYLETSARNIFACGDIASWPDERSGESVRVEHWVVAGRQGQTVARNILGRRERFNAVPFFWSAHFDAVICYTGHATKWDSADVDGSLERNDATIVYRAAGKVLAVATIGRDLVSLGVEDALERGDWSKLEEIIGGNKTGPTS